MAISKPKKPEKPKNPKPDVELLKSDVASFASSIGLSSAAPNSGFNDSDFRKKSSRKLQKPEKSQNANNKKHHNENTDNKNKNNFNNNSKKVQNKYERTDKPRNSTVLPADSRPIDRWKNLPKLPLMNASSLGVWFVDAAELEVKVMGKDGKQIEARNSEEWKTVVAKRKELAERLMAQYTQDFESSRGNSGDVKMLMATQRSGTAADKVSAFSVLVGENPIANMRSLDALLAMVTSKVGKRHALSGFEVLKELFLLSLLPDRKLKLLIQRPLNHLPESKDGNSLLLFWYWEECLKQRYERFVFALEEASRDMLPILKDKSLKTLYALLRSKSEQERRLLSALVNKLGDPENKGASNADFYLSILLSDHPNMKEIVINEVDAFLFRSHLNLRAKYHAVNFLSQIRLSHKGDGPKVAKRLVDVYFALFKVLISKPSAGEEVDQNDKKRNERVRNSVNNIKKENLLESSVEMDSRILSALLTGVNRAFPFLSSTEADDVIEVQTPMLFKLVHSKNFNVGVQALMLLDKISTKNQIVSDRFYRALYSKLLLPAVMHSSKAEMFIGLLLRAMKSDVNLKRVSAFSKRLLQVALQQPSQFACGCLFLLSEVLKARPPLWNTVLQSESIDTDLEHFEDIKEEPESEARSAQSIDCNDNDCVKTDSNSSDSEEENAQPASDSDDDDLDGDEDLLGNPSSNDVGEVAAASDHSKGQSQAPNVRLPSGYSPRHREPSYCNAECASWWELMVLASHAHPSVATMARTLLSGTNIVYNGNPLNDLSLTAFLDKFMEKKPKQTIWHGGSQIEPAKKLDTTNHLIGAAILSLAETDVPPEDLVFHKFYMNKMSSSKKPKKKKRADDEINEELLGVDEGDESDEEIGGDESDNEEIENMLDSTDGPLKTEGDYDYDDLDRVANDDDEDLIGNGSDAESDLPSDLAEEADGEDDDENSQVDIEEAYDDDGKHKQNKRKRNRKIDKKSGASPFASLEDYDHLLKDDVDDSTRKKKPNDSTTKKKPKSRKKQRSD